MNGARQPAVAGIFYPGVPDELKNAINGYCEKSEEIKKIPKAVISPHAGYMYSGVVAAQGYSFLKNNKNLYKKIFIIGPSHRHSFYGIALHSAEKFATPLGEVPVDQDIKKELLKYSEVSIEDKAHSAEHSVEVQIPFLQYFLEDFKIIPMVTGGLKNNEVSKIIKAFWKEKDVFFIVSSDLSHYLKYDETQKKDNETSLFIENFESEKITSDRACGAAAIRGLLTGSKEYASEIKTVKLLNSGDTSGDKKNVVGYGAYHIYS
ncbi:MAG: AmmeMemoRadiSam system protein B [Spirochaetia bacterium]|nr:AmmeMemoRadiSam system protein B [Spirochaetia bacterium]